LTGPAQDEIPAVFNGGFKLSDPSHPGYYNEGTHGRAAGRRGRQLGAAYRRHGTRQAVRRSQ